MLIEIKAMLNAVQKAAYELIQSDARFLYTLTVIQSQAKNINSNYIMMSYPYIGLFTDGAEQWCRKLGLNAPVLTREEKVYYSALRQGHKLYEMSYSDYFSALTRTLSENDAYFYNICGPLKKLIGYYNVGTDLCNGEFCGNTILCALYTPVKFLGVKDVGPWIENISIITGKLAAFFDCINFEPYKYNHDINVTFKDYHFYDRCPLKEKSGYGFLLFSILCSINYVIEFIDKYFVEEIPQKFKYAYLQYYYLCDFIDELNKERGTCFQINDSLKDRAFRNCLAHYGLGQYLTEKDIDLKDPLRGLTSLAFNRKYIDAKEELYAYLKELTSQIKKEVLVFS